LMCGQDAANRRRRDVPYRPHGRYPPPLHL
jgi:hypothetical protein